MRLIDAKQDLHCEPARMSAVRLILDLEPSEPVSGRLGVPGGPQRPFAGLLELIAAIDQFRAGNPPATGVDSSDPLDT
jgi:hypothetical protein